MEYKHTTFYKTENTIDWRAIITCSDGHSLDECGFIRLDKDYAKNYIKDLADLPEIERTIKELTFEFTYSNFFKNWGDRISGFWNWVKGKPFIFGILIDQQTREAWGNWILSDFHPLEPTEGFDSESFIIPDVYKGELLSAFELKVVFQDDREVIQVRYLPAMFPFKKRIKSGWKHHIQLKDLYVPVSLDFYDRLKLGAWLLKTARY